MNTLVTKLKGVVDNNRLPVITEDGKVFDYYVGRYYDKLKSENYSLTDTEINAITTFVKDGIDKGWIDYMLYFLPFIGDKEHYIAGCWPLIDNLLNYSQRCTVGSSLVFAYDENNKMIGTSEGQRAFNTPIKLAHMRGGFNFIATGAFSDKSHGFFGCDWDNNGNHSSFYSSRQGSGLKPNFYYKDSRGSSVGFTTALSSYQVSGPVANLGAGLWPIPIEEQTGDSNWYRNVIYITQDGSAEQVVVAEEKQFSIQQIAATDEKFKLGAYYSSGEYSVRTGYDILSFAISDPKMPAEQVKAYSDAVFALNVALGRIEEVEQNVAPAPELFEDEEESES